MHELLSIYVLIKSRYTVDDVSDKNTRKVPNKPMKRAK